LSLLVNYLSAAPVAALQLWWEVVAH